MYGRSDQTWASIKSLGSAGLSLTVPLIKTPLSPTALYCQHRGIENQEKVKLFDFGPLRCLLVGQLLYIRPGQ